MTTIGIDFGTTKTLVAYMDERLGRLCTVRLGRGVDHIPSSVYVQSGGGMLFGEDAAAFLRYVRERCEKEVFMGNSVTKADITCPAVFSPARQDDLKEAAEQAGFSHVELAPEPEAAGYAFCRLCPQDAFSGNALIVDWGGGRLDLALVSRGGDCVEAHRGYMVGDSCRAKPMPGSGSTSAWRTGSRSGIILFPWAA